MKTIFAAALSALVLTACTPYPPGGNPVPPGDANYRAIGTEPFWSLDIGRDMVFTDRGNNVTVVQPTPQPIHGVAGETYNTPRINANIVHAPCSDGMSDRTYPDRVQVRVDGREYQGCGGPVGTYGGEQGGAVALTETNWRVAAVNGQPTPAGQYFMNFGTDGRLSAKFGCNGMGASYSQTGSAVAIGALLSTKMACPDMRFENEGSAVLSSPLTVSGYGNRATLTSSAGSINLVRG